MKKHFVEFFSPGTMFAETTVQEIEEWNVDVAVGMAETIVERYNATPYCFRFFTRERGPDDLDSRITERSPKYYINCEVVTLDEIRARDDDADRILIQNMECNGWDRMAQTTKGWRWSQPLMEGDVVL